jgi:allophanate hydrolase subunit 2
VTEEIVMKLHLGPRLDWFAAGTVAELSKGVWTVSEHSNRVGLRLTGPRLRHAEPARRRFSA